MSAEGWKKVFPAYFEISMKHKFLADEESIEILDLIYSRSILDFGYVHNLPFYMILDTLLNTSTPSRDFTSYYDRNFRAAERLLQSIEDKYNELD
jgi:hypothetical protein